MINQNSMITWRLVLIFAIIMGLGVGISFLILASKIEIMFFRSGVLKILLTEEGSFKAITYKVCMVSMLLFYCGVIIYYSYSAIIKWIKAVRSNW